MVLAKSARPLATPTSITAADNYAAFGRPRSAYKSIRFFAAIDQPKLMAAINSEGYRSDKVPVNLSPEKLRDYSEVTAICITKFFLDNQQVIVRLSLTDRRNFSSVFLFRPFERRNAVFVSENVVVLFASSKALSVGVCHIRSVSDRAKNSVAFFSSLHTGVRKKNATR